MRLLQVDKCCVNAGNGFRTVIWTAGCNFHCEGCHNPESWDYNGGVEYTTDIKNKILEYVKENDFIDGISLMGGEPLSDCNLKDLEELCEEIHKIGKSVWCWTGYRYEEIENFPILKQIDVLVDGRYEQDKRDIRLHWKGSSNQRVLELKNGKIINEIK